MSEHLQSSPHPHLEQHPNAEQNVDKAHLMGHAMNFFESNSAAIRFMTERAMQSPGGADSSDNTIDLEHGSEASGQDPRTEAHPVHDIAQAYEGLALHEAISELPGGSINAVAKPENIVKTIESLNQTSDKTAELVSSTYDALQATKR